MLNTPSTLEELVAPLSEAEFLSLLRARKLALLRGPASDRYAGLLNWRMLRGMLERGEHPRNLVHLRLSRDSVKVPLDRWFSKNPGSQGSRVDIAKVEAYLAQGFSLCITCIDEHAPHLAALCNDIRARTFEQIKIGVIVTTGKEGAFKLHYDPEDLIILQVEGTKRWKVYGPAVPNPVIGMPPQTPPPEDVPIFDEVLKPGDFLFLPGGNWHRCENGPIFLPAADRLALRQGSDVRPRGRRDVAHAFDSTVGPGRAREAGVGFQATRDRERQSPRPRRIFCRMDQNARERVSLSFEGSRVVNRTASRRCLLDERLAYFGVA
jgi:hypothetical protein